MVFHQHGILRGVVIDDVEHDLHAASMNLLHQPPKGIEIAVSGVDRAEIPHGIGRAALAELHLFSTGMDGHEPHHIHTQIADAVEFVDHPVKVVFFRQVHDAQFINDE